MASNPGDDIAQGLKDSFGKAVSSPVDAVENAVGGAVDKVKGFLGIKSTPTPSADPSWHSDMVKKANQSFADASKSSSKPAAPKYHKGTDYVPKTGPAILKKGEAVLKKEDADKYRDAKGKNMSKDSAMKSVADELGGKQEEKPKKEIAHIKTEKGKSGGYIHTHTHTHPEHHPEEKHVSADQDEMVQHMMQNMGQPNPGEAEADAGQSGAPGASAAPAGPAAGAAPMPGAPAAA